MRFLMLHLGDRSADGRPTGSFAEAQAAFDDDLRTAGVVLVSESVRSTGDPITVRFGDGDPVVVDSSPARAGGAAGLAVRGFRILEVRSAADAIAWAARCPLELALGAGERAEIEIHAIDDGSPW